MPSEINAMAQPDKRTLSNLDLGLGLTAVLLALVSMNLWDQSISGWFQQERWHVLQRVSEIATDIGLGWPYFLLSALVFLMAHYQLNRETGRPDQIALWQKARWWSRFTFIALCTLGIVLHVIKFALGRQRPHMSPAHEPHIFTPATWDWDFQSLPSGHSEVTFVVATVLTLLLPRWKVPILLIAFLIAFTRVIVLQHFLSDVLFGAALGYLGTLILYSMLNKQTA